MPTGGLIAGIGDFGVTELVAQAEQAKESAESSADVATAKASEASASAESAIQSATGTVKRYTIAQLRLLSPNINDNPVYFSTDAGKEGVWKIKSGSSEADNLGTVLVCLNGARLERVFDYIKPEWFGAKGDGITDDTQAIQNAINSGNVRLSAKTYKITSTLNFPENRTFKGVSRELSKIYYYGKGGVYNGTNNNLAPTFNVLSGCVFEDFQVFYPEQVKTNAIPFEFGYTFNLYQGSSLTNYDPSTDINIDRCQFRRLKLLNPFKAFNLDRAAQYTIDDIQMQAILEGFYINRMFDVSRISNIHNWDFFTTIGDNLSGWIRSNCHVFNIGRCDNIMLNNIFSIHTKRGFNFFGGVINRVAWGNATNVLFDQTQEGIYIDGARNFDFSNIFLVNQYSFSDLAKGYGKRSLTVKGFVEKNINFSNVTIDHHTDVPVSILHTNGNVKLDLKLTGIGSGAGWRVCPFEVDKDSKLELVNFKLDANYINVSDNTKINGEQMPSFTTAIVSDNLNMSSWSSGKPNSWTLLGTNTINKISQINGGIRLSAVVASPNESSSMYYSLDKDVTHTGDLLLLELELSSNLIDPRGVYLRINILDDTQAQTCFYVGLPDNAPILAQKLRLPVRFSKLARPQKLQIEWICNTGITGYVDIKNIALKKASNFSSNSVSNFLDVITSVSNEKNVNINANNGNKVVFLAEYPTFGNWLIGDVIDINSVQYKCKASGKGHELLSTGDLNNGSSIITNVQYDYTWKSGDVIKGDGIPSGTTVAAVNTTTHAIQISNNATKTKGTVKLYDTIFEKVSNELFQGLDNVTLVNGVATVTGLQTTSTSKCFMQTKTISGTSAHTYTYDVGTSGQVTIAARQANGNVETGCNSVITYQIFN